MIATNMPVLSIQLDATGEVLDTIEEWTLTEGYWESADTFEVTLITDRFKPSELWMQNVTLLLGDVPWMKARIEVVQSDDNQVTMNLSGRDYLADLVEGHVSPDFKVSEKTSLADAIKHAAAPYGITTVLSSGDFPLRRIRSKAVAASKAAVDFKAVQLKELQPKDGQSVYEFCNRLAARSGCTIQPDIRRNTLALSVPAYDSPPIGELRRSRDRVTVRTNNIQSARATRDGTHWPSVLKIIGGTKAVNETVATNAPGTVAPGNFVERRAKTTKGVTLSAHTNLVEAADVVSIKRIGAEWDTPQVAEVFNPQLGKELQGKSWTGVRNASSGPLPESQFYRLFRQQDKELRTEEQMLALGMRVLGERLKATLVYDVTVAGFSDIATGKFWAVDTIVTVRDEIADVDEPLWVQSVTRSFSRGQGATTRMNMIRPGVVLIGADL